MMETPGAALFCRLGKLGDVLLSLPTIRLFKSRFPRAHVVYLTDVRAAPLFVGNPDVDRLVLVDSAKSLFSPSVLGPLASLTRRGVDLAAAFHVPPLCRLALALTGAKRRIAFVPAGKSRAGLTDALPPPSAPGWTGQAQTAILAPLGIFGRAELPKLYLSEAEREQGRTLVESLAPGSLSITLDAAHASPTKAWPAERFAKTIDLVRAQRPELRFIGLYGPGERSAVEVVRAGLADKTGLVVPDRVLNLREAAAVIGASAAHFGLCSLPRHLAVAVGTPSLVVLGSTGDNWTAPGGPHRTVSGPRDHPPCSQTMCGQAPHETPPPCLDAVSAKVAATALLDLLDASREAR